jgi:bacterioferritin (cytochrome b1)
MAAKGMVPVKGGDLVTLLVQLGADSDPNIAKPAGETLAGLPEGVLHAACSAQLHIAILDGLADRFPDRDDILERLVMNHATADYTVERVAGRCSETVSEAIAVNQQRILGAPKIIEALYKNANTRMSTADRLIELCARNGVVLEGIPSFQDHVEAIQGELIMEPEGDEPLPDDVAFQDALAADDEKEEALETDKREEKEETKKKFLPLRQQIDNMKKQQKIRLAMIGGAAARSILVRDHNKAVARAAISSPKMTSGEAAAIAKSKEVGEEILRYIAQKKKWVGSYEVKRALVFNAKTPFNTSLKFLSHLRDNDLKKITRSRNIAGPLKQAAVQRYEKKTKGRR